VTKGYALSLLWILHDPWYHSVQYFFPPFFIASPNLKSERKYNCSCIIQAWSSMSRSKRTYIEHVYEQSARKADWTEKEKVTGRRRKFALFSSYHHYYIDQINRTSGRNTALKGHEGNYYKILIAKRRGKKPLWRPRCRWVCNSLTDLKNRLWRCGNCNYILRHTNAFCKATDLFWRSPPGP
jgi:hypothetical protein